MADGSCLKLDYTSFPIKDCNKVQWMWGVLRMYSVYMGWIKACSSDLFYNAICISCILLQILQSNGYIIKWNQQQQFKNRLWLCIFISMLIYSLRKWHAGLWNNPRCWSSSDYYHFIQAHGVSISHVQLYLTSTHKQLAEFIYCTQLQWMCACTASTCLSPYLWFWNAYKTWSLLLKLQL